MNFIEDLKAEALGSYVTNIGLINLSRHSSFWNLENDPTIDNLGVFLHEYAHFLHNFSTVAGIYEFFAQIRLAKLFMSTVGHAGRSLGENALLPNQLEELRATTAWRSHLVGQQKVPYNANHKEHGLAVTSKRRATRSSSKVKLGPQEVVLHHAELHLTVNSSSWPTEEVSFKLGSHVLMESLAWEIERLLFESQGADLAVLEEVPVFPYKIGRIAFESIANCRPSIETLAKVLLLALQSTDPGASFVDIAEHFSSELDRHRDERDVLAHVYQVTAKELDAVSTKVKNESIGLEVKAFEGRGALGRGIMIMAGWCYDLLEMRREHMFFELEVIAKGLERDSLRSLLETCPACPVAHKAGPAKDELQLFFLSKDEPDERLMQDLGVAQGFMQFVTPHITSTGMLDTASISPRKCRFFGACKAPLSQFNPDVCLNRPWESFDPSESAGCWYGLGVMGSRARTG